VTQAGSNIPHPVEGGASYSRSWSNVTLNRNQIIIFDAYGSPNLSLPLTIVVSKGSSNRSLTIENVTGFTR
jgi:hypothetical protein